MNACKIKSCIKNIICYRTTAIQYVPVCTLFNIII